MQGCGYGMFIPDSGSSSASKNLSIFSHKNWDKIWNVHPGSGFNFHPGSVKKAPDPWSGTATLLWWVSWQRTCLLVIYSFHSMFPFFLIFGIYGIDKIQHFLHRISLKPLTGTSKNISICAKKSTRFRKTLKFSFQPNNHKNPVFRIWIQSGQWTGSRRAKMTQK